MARLYLPHNIPFSENFISQLRFMIESKLWNNKAETKNVSRAKMVGFIKTCD